MERLASLARLEAEVLCGLFASVVLWKLLTGSINMAGLLSRKTTPPEPGPDTDRVLMFGTSFLVALLMLLGLDEMRTAREVQLPSEALVYVLGGSQGLYLFVKRQHLKR